MSSIWKNIFRFIGQNNNVGEKVDLESKKSISEKAIKIITDEPAQNGILDFPQYSRVFSNIIINSPPIFSIGIFGDWGTGKTTLMSMIREELKDVDKNDNKILTIWFDPWKYERDEYLAFIPLLKLIQTEINNNVKKGSWTIIEEGIKRTIIAYIESSKFKVGMMETDLDTFMKSLSAGGSLDINGKKVNFYSHPTDHLKLALEKLRGSGEEDDKIKKEADKSKIVVFIDDLDRCTPENAVQVLESIKSFFALEGIIYVIGMNVSSINNIIKAKYGESSGVSAFDYMDKIVQLPFYIPDWNLDNLDTLINNIVTSYIIDGDSSLVKALSDNKKIILGAINNNPRAAKRFINDIILARSVFKSTSIESVPLRKLIVVQALNSRDEWRKFLGIITPDKDRKSTLEKLNDILKRDRTPSKEEIENFKESDRLIGNILDNYPYLFNENFSLRKFLDSGALFSAV